MIPLWVVSVTPSHWRWRVVSLSQERCRRLIASQVFRARRQHLLVMVSIHQWTQLSKEENVGYQVIAPAASEPAGASEGRRL